LSGPTSHLRASRASIKRTIGIGLLTVTAAFLSTAGLGRQSAPYDSAPQLMPQLGHAAVYSAALSYEGKYVLTSGISSTRLWDANTGQVIRLFKGNAGGFSPDSSYISTVVSNTTLLWEIDTGKEVRRFQGSRDSFGTTFSADGRYVLTHGEAAARLWDVATGMEVRKFEGHGAAVNSATFALGGKQVLTASADKTARLWDTTTGREVRRFEGHSGALISAVGSPDGKYVLTTSEDDKTVRLWDAETAREIPRRFQKDPSDYLLFRPATFSPDGRYVLTASWYTVALLWETESGREIRRFPHRGPVFSATFSPDGRYVLVSGIDKATQLLDAQTGQVIRLFVGYSNEVNSVSFSSDGKYALTSDGEGTGHLWDLEAGREVRRYKGSSSHIYSASFSPDCRRVLMPGNDTTAHIFDTETGKEWPRLRGHSEAVHMAAFSSRGEYVLTAGGDKTARLWDANSGRQLHKFKAPAGGDDVTIHASASFSPDEKFVLAEWGGKTAQAWERDTGREAVLFKGHTDSINSAVYSPDGKYVLTASFDKTARLWDAKSGRELRRFGEHQWPVMSAVFSPDSRYTLTASSDKKVVLFETETGQEVRRFDAGPGFSTFSATFSPDGRYVLAADGENTVWMWEAGSGQLKARFEGHPDTMLGNVKESASLSPDGKYMLTAQGDGTIRLWSVSTGQLLSQMMSFQDGTWVVTDAVGRFDTNNLERIEGLHWVLPDDPLSPLPVEIFMRQYYEPQLLTRILNNDKLNDIPPLTSLNRAQPKVKITDITLESGAADKVSVTVEVAQGRRQVRREGRSIEMLSGVYDLRLFRGGQLVGHAPAGDGEIRLSPQGEKAVVVFRDIKLPRVAGLRQLEFSAYAFNSDGVKSATDRETFQVPSQLEPVKGRAYLITVGINLYETPRVRSLLFSANDARSIRDALITRLRQTAEYDDVVACSFISDFEDRRDEAVIRPTKENIKTVFDLLSGHEVEEAQLQAIPDKLRGKLRVVGPQDLVLISFSTHGEADDRGNFYLYPYNVDGLTNAELLRRSISSEELSLWLRDMDAGEIVMILDTCHSGAALGADFKPGPMGSRGLGQLAYDKGMRILAATQADNIAIGSGESLSGLLTTALVRDGLQKGEAAVGGRITIKSWLEYGVRRVPALYSKEVPVEGMPKASVIQRPALFDFSKERQEVSLSR